MIVKINTKDVEINNSEIKFLDEKTGLTTLVKIDTIYISPTDSKVGVSISSNLLTPNGAKIPLPNGGLLSLPESRNLIPTDLIQKIVNAVFQNMMSQHGLKADQIYDATGVIAVKEAESVWLVDQKINKGTLWLYKSKKFRALIEHISSLLLAPDTAKTHWIEEK